jgi:hypothetical protein
MLKKQYLIIIAFLFLTSLSYGQKSNSLRPFYISETIPADSAVFYGNFIQRLGFSSGGFSQDITLYNFDTKEVFTFKVKPTFRSAKENAFFYVVKPGTYFIIYYSWIQSKWFGPVNFREPIFKGIDSGDDFKSKLISGEIKKSDLLQYSFTVTPNSLNYLGTWHFDTGMVSFSSDKSKLDSAFKDKYKKLDFSKALIILPN